MFTKKFLSSQEEQQIITAIQSAEKNTSGEIKVHLDSRCRASAINKATHIFNHLDMHKTKQRNGVLFYVAIKSKKFAIIADEGINNKVERDFWDQVKDLVLSHFEKGQFPEGLVAGILQTGEQLKAYFPYQKEDSNEISNSISIEK